MMQVREESPIGVFDSGVGGLSVVKAIQAELPNEEIIYLADQFHVPYGLRPLAEVRSFAVEISRFLLEQNAKAIVVACNAASAASLQHLRSIFPMTPFIGMEPAVKPAAETSASKIVAVLATPATFQGKLYASVVERFANGVILLPHTCPGLVAQIENGDLSGMATRNILEEALHPLLALGADTVVLGCTHYPFVIPLIQEICGPDVLVIDPAPAIARQIRRVLQAKGLLASEKSETGRSSASRCYTTGDPDRFRSVSNMLIDNLMPVFQLFWENGKLIHENDNFSYNIK